MRQAQPPAAPQQLLQLGVTEGNPQDDQTSFMCHIYSPPKAKPAVLCHRNYAHRYDGNKNDPFWFERDARGHIRAAGP
jgi:hypothetical protein